jgi:hypothetical protein
LAVLEGARRAEEELSKPLTLDKSRHYETWSDCYIQDGMRFKRDTLERVNTEGPVPICPEQMNIREHRQEVQFGKKRFYSQRGWLFDPATHLPIDP